MSPPRLQQRDVPPRVAWALEQAGLHPLLARLLAARGVTHRDEVDDALGRLLPPDGLLGAVPRRAGSPMPSNAASASASSPTTTATARPPARSRCAGWRCSVPNARDAALRRARPRRARLRAQPRHRRPGAAQGAAAAGHGRQRHRQPRRRRACARARARGDRHRPPPAGARCGGPRGAARGRRDRQSEPAELLASRASRSPASA